MSDDLKTVLNQVKSGDGKRYHFAYGTGKRTDGAGDGHLIIGAGGKKPKKSDVQAVCACQAFVEGVCWGEKSSNGTTYFFFGKPTLSTSTIAKMSLTAKKLTGKQYDFEVADSDQPSKVDEGKAMKEWKEQFAEYSPTIDLAIRFKGPKAGEIQRLKAQAVASSKLGGDMERALELWGDAIELAKKDLSAVFEKRLRAITEKVDKSGILPPAINEMNSLLRQAESLADRGNYGDGTLRLDRLEEMLKKEESKGGSEDGDDFKDRLKGLEKKISAKGTKWESAKEAKGLVDKARGYDRKGDSRHANEVLDELAALVG